MPRPSSGRDHHCPGEVDVSSKNLWWDPLFPKNVSFSMILNKKIGPCKYVVPEHFVLKFMSANKKETCDLGDLCPKLSLM